MVIDASKGVEEQTRKLFKVCTMRNIPIFTFINKMDREARDPYQLMEEIEQELGIDTCAVNWPIGSGKEFKGVYERNDKEIIRFIPVDGGRKEVDTKIMKFDDCFNAPFDTISLSKRRLLVSLVELKYALRFTADFHEKS